MKKRSIRERKEAFKKAYYEELNKQGLMDNKKEDLADKTKTELMEIAKNKDVKTNSKMTKAELLKAIEEA